MKKIFVLFTFLLFLLLPCLVYAADSYKLELIDAPKFAESKSVHYGYEIDPGKTLNGILRVQPLSTSVKPFDVYPVDAYMTANGFVGMKPESVEQENFGKWVSLGSQVAASESTATEIPYTITIPENATPGQYYGGFVVVTKESSSDEKAGSFSKIKMRFAVGLMLQIKGELNPSVKLQPIEVEYVDNKGVLTLPVENDGNVIMNLSGFIKVDGIFSHKKLDIPERKILPGTRQEVQVALDQIYLYPVRTSLNSTLDFVYRLNEKDEKKSYVTMISFTYFPIWFLIFVLLFCASVYFIIVKMLRYHAISWITHTVASNETIEIIAKRTNVSWKLIVKRNKLTAPYSLKKGQKIFVPESKK